MPEPRAKHDPRDGGGRATQAGIVPDNPLHFRDPWRSEAKAEDARAEDKLMYPLWNDEPMILSVAQQYRAVFDSVIVVVKPYPSAIGETLTGVGLTAIECAGSCAGMAQSIVCGVRATLRADGWLIALGDMPFIRTATIAAIYDAMSTGHIVVPACDGTRGNPVAFGRSFGDQLLGLDGDRGARGIVTANGERTVEIEVGDPGILADIDSIDSLARWGELINRGPPN